MPKETVLVVLVAVSGWVAPPHLWNLKQKLRRDNFDIFHTCLEGGGGVSALEIKSFQVGSPPPPAAIRATATNNSCFLLLYMPHLQVPFLLAIGGKRGKGKLVLVHMLCSTYCMVYHKGRKNKENEKLGDMRLYSTISTDENCTKNQF